MSNGKHNPSQDPSLSQCPHLRHTHSLSLGPWDSILIDYLLKIPGHVLDDFSLCAMVRKTPCGFWKQGPGKEMNIYGVLTSVSGKQQDWARPLKRSTSHYRRPQSTGSYLATRGPNLGVHIGDSDTGVALGNSLHTGSPHSASKSKQKLTESRIHSNPPT